MEKAFWIVSLIILLSDALFVLVNYRATQQVFEEALEEKGRKNEVSFGLNLRDQGLHMQQFATYLANQPDIRSTFLAGRAAVLAEGGGSGGQLAQKLRERLYELVEPGWKKVTGTDAVRPLHFHIGPGDTSFLRVHSPGKYGDDLSTIRHTITHAIRYNEPTSGFESGRLYDGIRGVAPIAVDTPSGIQAVGALEAGSSLLQMLTLLKEDTGVAYSVLLSKRYFLHSHWPEVAEKLMQSSPLIDGWYVEGSLDRAEVEAVIRDPAVRQSLGQREPLIIMIGDKPHSVYSYPFRDHLGNENRDQEPIGVVLSWHDVGAAMAGVNRSLHNNLLLGVIGFFIVEVLLFTAWTLARGKLQRVIDGQLHELADVNHALQKEVGLRTESELQLKHHQAKLKHEVRQRTASLSETVSALEHEVARRSAVERQLQHERDRARTTLHSIADGVISTDASGKVQYLNPTAEQLTGWTLNEACGTDVAQVFQAKDIERGGIVPGYSDCLMGTCRHQHSENTELVRRNGSTVVVEHSISPILDESGHPSGLVLVFHDDTEAKELENQLNYQASHDALTGLINRRAIEVELTQALQDSTDDRQVHAFLYIDLDQFKVVNDTCGHIAGDELLRQVAKLLKQLIRQSDKLARLGGDEFGLLLYQCPEQRAREIAEALLNKLLGFRFVWEERSFRIGASVGGAVIDSLSDSVESILGIADAACYMAKEKGRGRVQFAQPDDRELLLRQGEMNWVSRIQQAIAEDRLVLYAQPIVPVSNAVSHASHHEILVRMLDEQGSLIAPNAFIPAAERYGIMNEVDRCVIDRTLQLINRMDATCTDARYERFSINLSGESMADEGTLDYIVQRLAQYRMDPKRICFEVTETAAIANMTSAIDLISALKDRGCLFALDDFGSGLSSFGYLKALPVDFLKIDGAFVRHLDREPVDQVMVRAINAVGHAMNLKTIAEFVETEEIFEILRGIGVDYAQGFWLGRPKKLEVC